MWKVCYKNGKIYSSDDHKWADLPKKNVVWVISYGELWKGERMRDVHCGYDYYHPPPNIFNSNERLSVADLEGIWVTDKQFEKLMKKAYAQVVSK